jgi:hypothetical protein
MEKDLLRKLMAKSKKRKQKSKKRNKEDFQTFVKKRYG